MSYINVDALDSLKVTGLGHVLVGRYAVRPRFIPNHDGLTLEIEESIVVAEARGEASILMKPGATLTGDPKDPLSAKTSDRGWERADRRRRRLFTRCGRPSQDCSLGTLLSLVAHSAIKGREAGGNHELRARS